MPASLDRLDRQILHALGLNPRIPFRQLAAALDATEHTVARRYRSLVADGIVRVVALPTPSAENIGQLLRLHVHPGTGTQLANALVRRDDVAWIRIANAGTEIACGVRSPSIIQRDRLLLEQLPRTGRVTHVTAHEVLHHFRTPGYADWEGFADPLDPRQRGLVHAAEPDRAPHRLGPEDRAIVDALGQDARQSSQQLARTTGQTESTVRRRLATMLESGAIYLDRDLDPVPLGRPVSATLYIDVDPEHLHATGAALARHGPTTFVAAVTGPANLYAAVVTATIGDLYEYVSATLAAIDGVNRVETSLTGPYLKHARTARTRPATA